MMRRRRGMTTVEIALCILMSAGVVLPLVGLATTTGREASFSEARLLVQVRAHDLLDALESTAFDEPGRSTARPGTAAPPPADLPGSGGNGVYAEKLAIRDLEPDAKILTVEIAWLAAGEHERAGRPHVFRIFRIVSRPESSWLQSIPLPVTGPA